MPLALVTGASRGFGRAVADELATRGWTLVVDGRSTDSLADAARELTATGGTVTAIAGDVADEAHRESLTRAVAAAGRLDLLVNNAGVLGASPLPPLASYPLDELERVYRIGVFAPLALTQRLMPLLLAAEGTVVNLSSDAAVEAYEGWGGYGSAKAALDQLSNVLAAEQPQLRVYAYDPGDMRTQMHQAAYPGEDISDRPEPRAAVPALLRLLDSRAPSGRYRASDIAVSGSVEAAR